MHYYHITPFQGKQIQEDTNMLIGIVGAGAMDSGIAQSFVMEKGNQER